MRLLPSFWASLILLIFPMQNVSADFSYLEELKGQNKYVDYFMPAYDTPEDGWAMITDMCGPVGSWDHEIVIPYSDQPQDRDLARVKGLKGCIHIKGELGPNGELPELDGKVNATHSNRGTVVRGGLFVENLKTTGVGIPDNKHFAVMRNMNMSNWQGHAFITTAGNKQMYLELLDSYLGYGGANHAAYISNIAFANIQRNVFESPGKMHALRVMAQKSIIRGNKICNIQCNGTVLERTQKNGKVYKMSGMASLEAYVNGEHIVEDNEIVYHRSHNGRAVGAVNFRWRNGMNTVDRLRDGDYYKSIVWGTKEFNDPETWDGPMLKTVFRNNKITCYGVKPCYAFNIQSTYPYIHDAETRRLKKWIKENQFTTFQQVLDNSHPSWHGSFRLMTDKFRDIFIRNGAGSIPNKVPFPVSEGWKQKAQVTLDGNTGNYELLVRPVKKVSWCNGEVKGGECVNQRYYRQAEVVIK